jgi:hypothetical protein
MPKNLCPLTAMESKGCILRSTANRAEANCQAIVLRHKCC